MSKSTGESTKAVKEYLKKTNRPYSSNDIVNNLQSKFNKATVVKALDALVADSIVCERVNGKQKIYFFNQGNIQVDHEKLKEMDLLIGQLNSKMSKLKESVDGKEKKKKTLKEHIPMEQLESKIKTIRKETAQSRDKLKSYKERCKNVNPDDQKKVNNAHKTLQTEMRKRKRIASEAIDSMLEHCSKPKKAFLEEVGIECD
ncbi:PREDICTED: homologous-pairing protein 2 homolog [Rhagoletis zephyria]|uniref:homologous-pairing protein 2 homolog n=1 Tax=Rhagoletis zephyria TaxID=28612 RepID=UPI0008116CB7|nr:PREDICTED: homologous-pairing protein 2 homolog [Rhagoletis zephyria]